MIVRQGNNYLIDGPVTLDHVQGLLGEGAVFDGDSVVVDLAGVTRADSSALSLLLEWVRRSRDSGRRIAFVNLSHDMKSLAELYGIVELIPVAAD